jgi:hypothetical protein
VPKGERGVKILALFLALAVAVPLQAKKPSKRWWISVAFVAGSSAADIRTSWGRYELNPILGRGQFGARQAGIKIGLTTGLTLWQYWRIHKGKPEKPMVFGNAIAAGVTAAVAAHNARE